MDFEFVNLSIIDAGDFELVQFATTPPDMSRGLVPSYDFRMRVNGSDFVGQINLRIGQNDHIKLYAGNLGYKVDSQYRGRRLAARAIAHLLPLAKHHGMTELWICCNPENLASRRTCELAGAELMEIIKVPPETDLYARGDRLNCRYLLRL